MPKKKYTVQTPVRHDGKDYAPNDSIELDIPDDHYLLTDGVVADGKAVKAKAVKETPVEQPQKEELPAAPDAPAAPTEESQGD